MGSTNTILWKDDRAKQVEVAGLIDGVTGFDVEVNDREQVDVWTRLIETARDAEDVVAADSTRPVPPRRPVSRPAIYGGVVIATVSTFALLTGFAIWRGYTVNAELTANGMRFLLRPPGQPLNA